jgi:hypothetical protein
MDAVKTNLTAAGRDYVKCIRSLGEGRMASLMRRTFVFHKST